MLLRYTPQDGLFAIKSSSSLREIQFSHQKFLAGKPISDIKYKYLRSQNNHTFYLFNNQLDYLQAQYFAKFEITKGNIGRFLFDLFIVLLIIKLFYQNTSN